MANICSVIAFREIVRGHTGMERFPRVMNVNCFSSRAYKKMKDDISEAYETVDENSMKTAAKVVYDKSKKNCHLMKLLLFALAPLIEHGKSGVTLL